MEEFRLFCGLRDTYHVSIKCEASLDLMTFKFTLNRNICNLAQHELTFSMDSTLSDLTFGQFSYVVLKIK